jgi:hypothetical protein
MLSVCIAPREGPFLALWEMSAVCKRGYISPSRRNLNWPFLTGNQLIIRQRVRCGILRRVSIRSICKNPPRRSGGLVLKQGVPEEARPDLARIAKRHSLPSFEPRSWSG